MGKTNHVTILQSPMYQFISWQDRKATRGPDFKIVFEFLYSITMLNKLFRPRAVYRSLLVSLQNEKEHVQQIYENEKRLREEEVRKNALLQKENEELHKKLQTKFTLPNPSS